MFFVIIYILAILPVLIILPTKVLGKKNFKKGKKIVICNHTSNFDPILLDFYLRKKIRFLGKKELFKNKFMAWIMKGLGVVKVDRGHADLTATKTILTLLKQNQTVGIFPQGTRSDEENLEIKNGVCMFAIKSKAPIVPMYIVKKPKLFRFNKILVGKPFELSEFYDQKLTKEILDKAGEKVVKSIESLKIMYEQHEQEKILKKQYKKIKKSK